MLPGEAYREGRERITAAVGGLDDQLLDLPVPACPRWRVHDVAAHLSGVCADLVAGRIDGVATEPWTSAQVAARRGWPIGRILDEWDANASKLEAEATDRGRVHQWIFDLACHEHDLRGALRTPWPGESSADRIALGFAVRSFGSLIDHTGMPGLRVRTSEGDLVLGAGDPQAAVTTTRHELLRLLTGRRSLDQVRALAWEGDPAPYLERLARGWGPFRAADTPLDD